MALAALPVSAVVSAATGDEPTAIHSQADWYRERTEREQSWRGSLEKRETPAGPGARTALRYTLVTPKARLPVYAPPDDQRLEPFVGHEVVVVGKRIDLTAEGFGPELWVGSVARAAPPHD